jgi:hypothetical protein
MNFKRYDEKQDSSSKVTRSEKNKSQIIKRNCITQTYTLAEDFISETIKNSKKTEYIGGATQQTLYMQEGQIAFTYAGDISNGNQNVRTVLNGLDFDKGKISNKITVEGVISYSVDTMEEREIGVIPFGQLSVKNTSDITLVRGDKIRWICPPTYYFDNNGVVKPYDKNVWEKEYIKKKHQHEKIDNGDVKIELIMEKVDNIQTYKKMLNDSVYELHRKGYEDDYFDNYTIKNDQYYSQVFCQFLDYVQYGTATTPTDKIVEMARDNKSDIFQKFVEYVKHSMEYHATVTMGADKGDYVSVKLNLW